MRFLIDTHVLIWLLRESHRLTPRVREVLRSTDTTMFVSSITGYELAQKFRQGKLPEAGALLSSYNETLTRLHAEELDVSSRHALLAGSLPGAHRDPFDRILVAQAVIEGMPLVSSDRALDSLGIQRYW